MIRTYTLPKSREEALLGVGYAVMALSIETPPENREETPDGQASHLPRNPGIGQDNSGV